MDHRSRGFRLAAAAVMLVFLLAVTAFATAEARPIRVSSLSEPQSDVSDAGRLASPSRIYNRRQKALNEANLDL
jgi:hypothetical protein